MSSQLSVTQSELPYLTGDFSAIPGKMRAHHEDFVVEEIPLYQPCGKGTHVYFGVRKAGMTTFKAIRAIAEGLGVLPRQVGYAGLKDSRAVTTQTMSLEHVGESRVRGLNIRDIEILWTHRHNNKLKIGHLAGNRFALRIRHCPKSQLGNVQAILDILKRRGVPNYFGPQRFGLKGDSWRIGSALIRRDWESALGAFLGCPAPQESGRVRMAREHYDNQDYEGSLRQWPHPFRDERIALKALLKTKGNHKRAAFGMDKTLKRLFLSAYQSYIFNIVLAERVGRIDQLETGDLAYLHHNGAVFMVTDVAAEQPRCDNFEISATGPLFGYRMSSCDGEPSRREAQILAGEALSLEDFRAPDAHKLKGGRRPLRFPLSELQLTDGHDASDYYIQLEFTLPAGCYATAVIREILKTDQLDAIKGQKAVASSE